MITFTRSNNLAALHAVIDGVVGPGGSNETMALWWLWCWLSSDEGRDHYGWVNYNEEFDESEFAAARHEVLLEWESKTDG